MGHLKEWKEPARNEVVCREREVDVEAKTREKEKPSGNETEY